MAKAKTVALALVGWVVLTEAREVPDMHGRMTWLREGQLVKVDPEAIAALGDGARPATEEDMSIGAATARDFSAPAPDGADSGDSGLAQPDFPPPA